MSTYREATQAHSKCVVSPEGDYWQAACLGCDWKSSPEDTKQAARDEHIGHITEVLLAYHRSTHT